MLPANSQVSQVSHLATHTLLFLAMAIRAALFLSLICIGLATVVDDVVNGTKHVIGELQDESKSAQQRFADPSNMDAELDKIGRQEETSFDAHLYSARQQAFSHFAQRASEKAKDSLSATNATKSEEALDEAEVAFKKMDKAGDELDAMEKEFHSKLQAALAAKLDPELKTADKFSGAASHMQSEAHSLMDPLYSWGDDAEDQADKLNDETDDALSSVDKVVRTYRRHIVDHSRSVQRSVQRKLFIGQDRTATWRKVHRQVRQASGHVYVQQYLADVGLLGLPFSGVLTLSVTAILGAAAVAAAVAASTAGYILVVKSRNSESSSYQQLSA